MDELGHAGEDGKQERQGQDRRRLGETTPSVPQPIVPGGPQRSGDDEEAGESQDEVGRTEQGIEGLRARERRASRSARMQ